MVGEKGLQPKMPCQPQEPLVSTHKLQLKSHALLLALQFTVDYCIRGINYANIKITSLHNNFQIISQLH